MESSIDNSFVDAKKGESASIIYLKRITIHVALTSENLPLGIVIGSGSEYDPYRFEETLQAIKVRTGYRPIKRPNEIVVDSVYDDTKVREYLCRRRIKASIP